MINMENDFVIFALHSLRLLRITADKRESKIPPNSPIGELLLSARRYSLILTSTIKGYTIGENFNL